MDHSGTKTIKFHEFHGDIEFKNVTFAYPTRPDAVCLFAKKKIKKTNKIFLHQNKAKEFLIL